MKLLLVMLSAFIFVGCAHNPYKHMAGTVESNGLSRFLDKEKNVLCYVYENGDGPSLSCLKNGE